MFRRLGILAARHPFRILAAWVILLVAVLVTTPKLGDVVNSSQASYLPAGANSQRAQAILQQAFPHSYSQSTAVLVVTGPRAARTQAVADYSAFAAHRLRPAPFGVASDSLTPELRGALDSRDGAATLIMLGWRQLDSSSAPSDSLTNLRAYIAAHRYPGVTAGATGDVAINVDYQAQINKSTDVTTIATVILVLAILLIVFRSVALLIVPMLTIVVSLLISMGVVAELGTHGLIISSNTPIFMIVLLAGAGTDYCLFLASRFREELAAGKDPGDALIFTMTHVGEAIASSAAAVILGIGGMVFAQFGLFNTTGPAVAVSVAITLAAALTITPALLRILGRGAFWPSRVQATRPSRFWRMVGQLVTTRPLTAVLAAAGSAGAAQPGGAEDQPELQLPWRPELRRRGPQCLCRGRGALRRGQRAPRHAGNQGAGESAYRGRARGARSSGRAIDRAERHRHRAGSDSSCRPTDPVPILCHQSGDRRRAGAESERRRPRGTVLHHHRSRSL